MTTTGDNQWTVSKEAIDSVNRSTVAFLENAAKLCVDRSPAMASLLSHKAHAVNSLLPVSYFTRSAGVPRCQTCHLAQESRAGHCVQLAANRRPKAKRLDRAMARNGRQVVSRFDKHVLACAKNSLMPAVVFLCRGCGAENRIGRLSVPLAKKSRQLDDSLQNQPSTSNVSIDPNHGLHGRKRKKRKTTTVVEAAFNLTSVVSSTPLPAAAAAAAADSPKNNSADSSRSFTSLTKPSKRRGDASKLQRQLASSSVEQSPNLSHDLFSFLNSLK